MRSDCPPLRYSIGIFGKSIRSFAKGGKMKRIVLGIAALALCAGLSGLARVTEAAGVPPIPAVCGPMDIVFVVDDTGSMYGAIANVKASLTTLITSAQAASGNDLHMGLVTFKDSVLVRLPLTDSSVDATAITSAVNALSADGGAYEPEASDQAIKYIAGAGTVCLESGSPALGTFRPAAKKIAVLVTDAHPGGCDDFFQAGVDDLSANQAADAAAAAGILISAIYVSPYPYPDIQAIMAYYASTTGGVYTEDVTSGLGVAAAIDEIIAKCGLSSNKCPRSQGYWKTHPDAWPLDAIGNPLQIEIGGHLYLQSELLAVLARPVRGNAVLILAKQAIAAKLNILNGSNPGVIATEMAGADALLTGVLIGVDSIRTNTAVGKEMTALATTLDRYNNRLLTPDCEDNDE